MKKLGLLLILIIALGVIPVTAQTDNFYTIEALEIYKDSAGYDTLYKPDGTVFIYSQRYTIEALEGPKWKQVSTPFNVYSDGENIVREYTDYIGTSSEVIYKPADNGGIKTDVVIHSGVTREYRIKWALDGITNTDYVVTENGLNFTSVDNWVHINWDDAFKQYGEITEYTISDSANGKKLDITFTIGIIEAGKTFTLDPEILAYYYGDGALRTLGAAHPSANTYNSIVGQSFNCTEIGQITSVWFNISKSNNPTGLLTAHLYAHNGTLGINSTIIGSSLATSDTLNSSTLTAAYVAHQFNFTGYQQALVQAGTQYCIVLKAGAGIAAPNTVRLLADNTAPSHEGNFVYYQNGAFGYDASYDIWFELWFNPSFNDAAVLIDNAFELFGIYGYLATITAWINGLTGWFESSLTGILTMLVQQFRVIDEVFTWFTLWTTNLIGVALDFSEFWQSLMDGTSVWIQPIYGIGNFWNLIGYNLWAPAVPMLLFIWWLDSIPKRGAQTVGGEMQVFINDLNTAIGLISYFVSIFSYVANAIIDRVYGLFPAIT